MEEKQCIYHSGHTARFENIEREIALQTEAMRINNIQMKEIGEKIAVGESQIKQHAMRLNSHSEQTAALIKMGSAIEHMAEQIKEAITLIKEHDSRLDNLEKIPNEIVLTVTDKLNERVCALEDKPGQIAIKSWIFVGVMVATAIVSFMLGKVGL